MLPFIISVRWVVITVRIDHREAAERRLLAQISATQMAGRPNVGSVVWLPGSIDRRAFADPSPAAPGKQFAAPGFDFLDADA